MKVKLFEDAYECKNKLSCTANSNYSLSKVLCGLFKKGGWQHFSLPLPLYFTGSREDGQQDNTLHLGSEHTGFSSRLHCRYVR